MNSTETTECWTCETPFEWTRPDRYAQPPRLCGTCAAEVIERNYQAAIAKAEDEILKLTPTRYQATDINHPEFNAKLWERVKSWRPSSERPWLGLSGPTGDSKTRNAFLVLRAVALDMIRPTTDPERKPWIPSIEIVSAYRFAEIVAGQFIDDSKLEAVARLRALRRASVLMIDDAGKQRNTPAVSSELFALLDHRHAENLCTIWTSNTTPEGIVNGMTEDLAAPLAGRIRECSTIINLS
jgi:hypothetical protein